MFLCLNKKIGKEESLFYGIHYARREDGREEEKVEAWMRREITESAQKGERERETYTYTVLIKCGV